MTVIQLLLLAAVHEQGSGALTLTLAVPPLAQADLLVGEIEYVHVTPDWFTVNVLPAMAIVPDLELVLLFAATE